MSKNAIKKSEIKALISLLDDEDLEILKNVESKLLSLGGEVIPFLEEEWEHNFNPTVQRKIEEIIHALQFENLLRNLAEWYQSKDHDLLTGMWLVASYQYPDLEISKIKSEIEQVYYDAWVEFKQEDLHPYDQIKILNGVLFSKLKFSANTKNFHSPGNSMINVVLESKKGNPISLCAIYLMVAQKLDLPIYGVNLPNLFILTYKTKDLQFYINAFNRGLIFLKEDIDNYIAELKITPEESYYQPCSSKEILQRVLRNLMVSFEKIGDHDKVDEVKKMLNTISDGPDIP